MNLKKKTSVLKYCLKSPLGFAIESLLGIAFILKIGQVLGTLCCNFLGLEANSNFIILFGFLSTSLLICLIGGIKWVIEQIIDDYKIILKWLVDIVIPIASIVCVIFVPYWIGLLAKYISNKFNILTQFLSGFGNGKFSTWSMGLLSVFVISATFAMLLLFYYIVTSIRPSLRLFKAATYIPIEKEELISNNINNAQELEDFFVNVIFKDIKRTEFIAVGTIKREIQKSYRNILELCGFENNSWVLDLVSEQMATNLEKYLIGNDNCLEKYQEILDKEIKRSNEVEEYRASLNN